MKKILIILLTIVALGYVLAQKDYTAPHVSHFLKESSLNYSNENFACLDYFTFNNNVYIYHYNIPKTSLSTPFKVRANACKKDQMPIHNHPIQHFQKYKPLHDYYYKYTGDSLLYKDQMVYMSGPDMRNGFLFGYEYIGVSANGKWAYWSRSQIAVAWLTGVRLLRPIKGQISDSLHIGK